ncbi:MAG: Holliday junction branch migration protein RuvA [Rhodospirillaceae bacterium]
MIAKLKGILDSVGDDWAVLDVTGVGYQVFCSSRTLSELPQLGEAVALSIETHVREDHIHLYGFASAREREAFLLVTKVQGVGNKVALAILSALSPDQIAEAVAAQDKTPFTRASGVGPKLAARIVTELKDKVAAIVSYAALASVKAGVITSTSETQAKAGLVDDAVSALVNLGYGRADAFGAVSRVLQNKPADMTLDVVIRDGLKDLSSHG